MIKRRLWFIVTVMILIIPGCGVNSNLMWNLKDKTILIGMLNPLKNKNADNGPHLE